MGIGSVLVVLSLVGCLLCFAAFDFYRWTKLGVGGLPHTLRGWITVTRMRFQKRETTSLGVYDTADTELSLAHLPQRRGDRPRISRYPIPHRQLNQTPADDTRRAQKDLFENKVRQSSGTLDYRKSHFEKHNDALYVREEHLDKTVSEVGEVAHIHPSDASMHMLFSPADCREIILKGWGERHPLGGVLDFVPLTYLLIYAPRDSTELRIVDRLLDAAIGNACICGLCDLRPDWSRI